MKKTRTLPKIMGRVREISRELFLFKIGGILRYFKKRKFPVHPSVRVLVHFGCGAFNDPAYINVDTRSGWHIHHIGKIEDCAKLFAADSIDLIYACHVLEHVSHLKLSCTIQGLFTCLKKGGILRLSVPDFDALVKVYRQSNSIADIVAPLMGGQGYPGNFHCSAFNEPYLKELLLKAGFSQVRTWEPETAPDHNFDDWSKRPINVNGNDWQISLNLEAVK